MRLEVEERAAFRCEYCHAPQNVCAYTFHLEHIVPRAKGGPDTLANLALSCFWCNSKKGDRVEALDPETGRSAPLFHPRRQRWSAHFALSRDGLTITGKTGTGRATVRLLELNSERRREARVLWIEAAIW